MNSIITAERLARTRDLLRAHEAMRHPMSREEWIAHMFNITRLRARRLIHAAETNVTTNDVLKAAR